MTLKLLGEEITAIQRQASLTDLCDEGLEFMGYVTLLMNEHDVEIRRILARFRHTSLAMVDRYAGLFELRVFASCIVNNIFVMEKITCVFHFKILIRFTKENLADVSPIYIV